MAELTEAVLLQVCLHPALMYEGYLAPPGIEELVGASGKFSLLYNILPKLQLAGHRCAARPPLCVSPHACATCMC